MTSQIKKLTFFLISVLLLFVSQHNYQCEHIILHRLTTCLNCCNGHSRVYLNLNHSCTDKSKTVIWIDTATGCLLMNCIFLINKFPHFMESEGALPHSQEPTTGP
jgi:hypothetical protein